MPNPYPDNPRVSIKPIPGAKQNLIGMKFDFLAKALADPANRGLVNKARLTPLQGGVLAVLVNRVNAQRGYAYASIRHVADVLGAWPSTIGVAVKKLVDQRTLVLVAGGKKNRAQRLVPNWFKYLDVTEYGFTAAGSAVHDHDEDSAVHDHEEDDTVHVHGDDALSMPMEGTKRNVGSDHKGKEPKRSGPPGPGGDPAEAGSPSPRGPGNQPGSNSRKGGGNSYKGAGSNQTDKGTGKAKRAARSYKGKRRSRTGTAGTTYPSKDGVLAERKRARGQ